MHSLSKELSVTSIANALSLSKTTVSRAISGNGRVSAATKARVLNYIDTNEHDVDMSTQRYARGVIGIVMPTDSNIIDTPFFFGCQLGICETASLAGYGVLLLSDNGNSYDYFRKLILGGRIDGLIFTRSINDPLLLSLLIDKNIPFVVTGSVQDSNIVQIDSDVVGGCLELTKIILSSCSRVAFIGGDQSNRVQRLRYEGFLQAFIDIDRFADKSLVFLNSENSDKLDDAMELIMQRGANCVIASDDVICLKLLYWLISRNLRVPEDIKVASFYNSSYLSKHIPPISCVNIDSKAIGISAADMLLDIIAGRQVPKRKLVNHEILIRKSTL